MCCLPKASSPDSFIGLIIAMKTTSPAGAAEPPSFGPLRELFETRIADVYKRQILMRAEGALSPAERNITRLRTCHSGDAAQ